MEYFLMENKKIISKSNELNVARYKLTAMEQKLILSVIAEIQPTDDDFKIYQFTVTELINLLKLEGKNLYRDIKKLSENLLDRRLIIVDSKNNFTLLTHWFSSIQYFNKKGYIEFSFDPKLKPYLLQLKECFVSYHLKNIVQLKSSYSIRIYELLKQYEKIGNRTFELAELKHILGISENDYLKYSHFKSRVLLPSQKEIPEKTDLKFTFKEIKNGREIVKIKFIIKQKNKKKLEQKKIDVESSSEKLKKLVKILPDEQRAKKTIQNLISKYLTQYDPVYVARNIKYANQHSKENYHAFLSKSLIADWGIEIQEEEEAKAIQVKAKQKKEKLKAKEEATKKQKQKKIDKYIKANYDKLKAQAMKTLDKEMRQELKTDTALGRMALLGAITEMAEKKLKL